ncbi:MAG: hypothetical protein WAW80_02600 [Candidatus Saccharimonadales bacterium]
MNLREEGKVLLESTGIEAILGRFGVVTIGGSYAYNLLVDRDIDIDVRLGAGDELTYDLRAEFGAMLLREIHQMRDIKVADIYHFPKAAKHKIEGIWFGLDIISGHSGERWNIDVWLVKHDSALESDAALTTRVMNLTDVEREIILARKQEALQRGLKEKGTTSTQIYEAVLTQGARTLDDIR